MNAMFDLNGKAALVTGANTGIGQAIAVALAAAGANVAVAGRSDPSDTIRAISDAGRRSVDLRADLADTSGLDGVVTKAHDAFGRLDVLVNNAGIIRRNNAIDFTEKDWDDVIATNLKSVFFLAQSAAKVMIPAGSGKIINIASLLSFQGGVRVPSYASAKSGVAGLTKALANEWAAKGVQVNAIAPGYITTNNTAALQADETRNRQILERIPAARWGRPEDLSGAAVFLSSSASDYVNGHVLVVDGGWLAR